MNQMAQDQQFLSSLWGDASIGAFSSLAPPPKSQATPIPTQPKVTQEEIKGGGNAAADSIFRSGVVIEDLENF